MSRPKRWAKACDELRTKVEAAQEAFNAIEDPMSELIELRDEYQDWKDNLPENLDQSPVSEKLGTLLDDNCAELDQGLENFTLEELLELAETLEGADLPLGFGRD